MSDRKELKELTCINTELFLKGTAEDIIAEINNLVEQTEDENYKIEIYLKALQVANNPKVLNQLIKAADKIRDKRFLDTFLDILLFNDKQKYEEYNLNEFINVRCLCSKAIANLKDTKAVLALLYCLNNKDENYKLRLDCAEALGKIGDKYAVTPLIDVVSDETEKSVYIRESAALALGMLGDSRAIDPLVGILQAKQGIIDKFTFLKERIIEALGKMNLNNDKVFSAMKLSLMDESAQVRIGAIEGLMNSEDPRAAALIRQMIKDPDQEVVKNATIALYNLEGEDAMKEILESESVSEIAKSAVIEILEEVSSDEEEEQ